MESAIVSIFVLLLSTMVFAHRTKEFLSIRCQQKPKSIVEEAHDCCPMPDLFAVESMAGCGIDLEESALFPSFRGSPDCAQRTCLLRNHDLLFDNDDIDNEAIKQYLDEWTDKRKEYVPAVNAVKETCLDGKPMFGPAQMCSADRLIFCIHANFYEKCPHWKDSEGCNALRLYFEDCVPYFQ